MQRYLSLARFFQRRKNSRGRKHRGVSHPIRRLCHEHLEDRSLLAVLWVTTAEDNVEGSLRWAIGEANTDPEIDEIRFCRDLAEETIELDSGRLQITDDLTITGLGAELLTISGKGNDRIFSVYDGSLTTVITVEINGLSLVDGLSRSGGAIFNGADLTIQECVLVGNYASAGGGIFNYGTLTVTHSTLRDNHGSGLYNSGTLTVTHSTLANNSAHHGGGIRNSGTARITDTTLADNSAHYGGGISNSGTLMVTDTTLANNRARHGGGIFNGGRLEVTDSTLANNWAVWYGGGIDNRRDLTVTHSTLDNNSARHGGGIFNGPRLEVTDGTLDENSAERDVSSIEQPGRLTLTHSKLANNSADHGGGIRNSGTARITGSRLLDNSADSRGGGMSNSGTLTVTDTALAENSAHYGGGISNSGTLMVTDTTLANNSAEWYGGGIDNRDTLTVTHSTLAYNSAHYGGAVRNSGTMAMINSTLAYNWVYHSGGGIFNGAWLEDPHSTLADNSAARDDSDMENSGTLTITNSTLANNRARHHGGGIFNGSSLTINNSLVGGNSALSGPDILNAHRIIAAYNVIQDGDGSGIEDGVDGNQVGVDPLLDPNGLQDNGGPTQTIALLRGSPAINAGNDELAVDPNGDPLEFDQRGPGFPRFVGTVDVGALEMRPIEQIEAISASIQHRFDEGVLNRGQTRSLRVKLDQIQRSLDAGQTHVALNQLNAFTNHVAGLIAYGVLPEEEDHLLLDAAEDLRTGLTVMEDEAAVDAALADDKLLEDVLPSVASVSRAGRRR